MYIKYYNNNKMGIFWGFLASKSPKKCSLKIPILQKKNYGKVKILLVLHFVL